MAAKIEWSEIEDQVQYLVADLDELTDTIRHQQDNYVPVPAGITGAVHKLEMTIRQFYDYLFEDDDE